MEWVPSSKEKDILNYWFDSLDEESGGFVGGKRIVLFLKATNLNLDTLRAIWDIVDVSKRGTVDRVQFYKLMRVTSICCTTPNCIPSEHLYATTLKQSIPLPNLSVSKEHLISSTKTKTPPLSHSNQPVAYQYTPTQYPHGPPPHYTSHLPPGAYPYQVPVPHGYPPHLSYGAYGQPQVGGHVPHNVNTTPLTGVVPGTLPPSYHPYQYPGAPNNGYPLPPNLTYNYPYGTQPPPHIGHPVTQSLTTPLITTTTTGSTAHTHPITTTTTSVTNATTSVPHIISSIPYSSQIPIEDDDFNDFEIAPTQDPFADIMNPNATSTTNVPKKKILTNRVTANIAITTATVTTQSIQDRSIEDSQEEKSSSNSDSNIGGINNRMHILDELIEADLQMANEQWDDFADSNSAAPATTTATTSDATSTKTINTTIINETVEDSMTNTMPTSDSLRNIVSINDTVDLHIQTHSNIQTQTASLTTVPIITTTIPTISTTIPTISTFTTESHMNMNTHVIPTVTNTHEDEWDDFVDAPTTTTATTTTATTANNTQISANTIGPTTVYTNTVDSTLTSDATSLNIQTNTVDSNVRLDTAINTSNTNTLVADDDPFSELIPPTVTSVPISLDLNLGHPATTSPDTDTTTTTTTTTTATVTVLPIVDNTLSNVHHALTMKNETNISHTIQPVTEHDDDDFGDFHEPVLSPKPISETLFNLDSIQVTSNSHNNLSPPYPTIPTSAPYTSHQDTFTNTSIHLTSTDTHEIVTRTTTTTTTDEEDEFGDFGNFEGPTSTTTTTANTATTCTNNLHAHDISSSSEEKITFSDTENPNTSLIVSAVEEIRLDKELTPTFSKANISDAFSFDDDSIHDAELPVLPPLTMMTSFSNNTTTTEEEVKPKQKVDIFALLSGSSGTNNSTTHSSHSNSSTDITAMKKKNTNNNDNDDEDFGDFENSFVTSPTTTTTTSNVNTSTTASTTSHQATIPIDNSLDFFTTTPVLPSITSTTATATFTSASEDLFDTNIIPIKKSIPIQVSKPKFIFVRSSPSNTYLTLFELQTMINMLLDMCLYEEAYLCHQQYSIQSRIQQYEIEKNQAVSTNNTELITKLTDSIDKERNRLLNKEIEHIWIYKITTQDYGESLEDCVDIIETISKTMALRCRERYLSNLPEVFTPIDEKVLYYKNAKKSIKLIMILLTTHIQFPDYWKNILTFILTQIEYATKKLNDFEIMSTIDKEIILNSNTMKTYLNGLIQLSLVGMYISATCIDAMVKESLALEVVQKIQMFMSSAVDSWKLTFTGGYRHVLPSLSDLSDQSTSSQTSKLLSSSDYIYCNLTLRPIGYKHHTNTTQENEDTVLKNIETLYGSTISYYQDRSFLQAAINIWLHDISYPKYTMPQCDDIYQ